MRILSRSPAPSFQLNRLYGSINRHYTTRVNPTRSRFIALLAWLVSLFSLATILCVNLGGVSWPLASKETPISRLGNPGFELLQWFFDGPPPSTSIANFYHYRLSLNRLCAINPTRQRGYGLCYNAGPLSSFRFSQHSPDSYIAHERAYDAVVGRIDFFSPFLFYLIAGACCATSITLLPLCIVIEGAGEASTHNVTIRHRAAASMFGQALCLALASGTLTYSVLHLAKWMQFVPQVSHIWTGTAPLALTWASTAGSIICALAMLDDAAVAQGCRQHAEYGRSMSVPKRGRSKDRIRDWDAAPQDCTDGPDAPWGFRSPRKRMGHSASISRGAPDIESGVIQRLDVDDRRKNG